MTKMHSSCNKSYKIEYKATVIVFVIIVFINTKKVTSTLIFFLNCCTLGNCVISLARPFHMCIPLTVIDSSLWVVFAFLT